MLRKTAISQEYVGDNEGGIGEDVRAMRIVLHSQQSLHDLFWEEAGVAGNLGMKARGRRSEIVVIR